MSDLEIKHGYPVSRDYELLDRLLCNGQVACFTNKRPDWVERRESTMNKGKFLYMSISTRLIAHGKEQFIDQCHKLNLAFIVPSSEGSNA